MFNEALFCRLCPLPHDNFGFVSECLHGFAKSQQGTPEFEVDNDSVSWVEPIAFELEDSSWSSGFPACPIRVRTAVARIGILTPSSSASYDIFGIITCFSSLSAATRRYIVKQFLKKHPGHFWVTDINLQEVLESPPEAEIAGFSYEAGGVLHSIAGQGPLPIHEASAGTLKSLSFRAKHGSVDVQSIRGNQEQKILPRLQMVVTEDPEGFRRVVEDLKFVFGVISGKVRVIPVQPDIQPQASA